MKNKEMVLESTGTYVGMKFADHSVEKLMQFAEDHNVPNALPKHDYHTTVLYSKKFLHNYKPRGCLTEPLFAIPKSLEIWNTAGKDKKCLVLNLHSPGQVHRSNEIINNHNTEHDFKEYKPHLTISYDVGDNFDVSSTSMNIQELEIVSEYATDLILSPHFRK